MNCFYHPEAVSLGICKCCNKGLCALCAIDVGKGLACRGECETYVVALNKSVDHALKAGGFNRYVLAAFYLAFGMLFLGFALYRVSRAGFQANDSLFWGMGILFFAYGLICFRRNQKLRSSH
jgi:hypothetical protein